MMFDPNIRTDSNRNSKPLTLDSSLANLNESVVFIAIDTEGTHRKWQPGKPKYSSYGFTILDMAKVAGNAPGDGAKNWHELFNDFEFFRHDYESKELRECRDFGGMCNFTKRIIYLSDQELRKMLNDFLNTYNQPLAATADLVLTRPESAHLAYQNLSESEPPASFATRVKLHPCLKQT